MTNKRILIVEDEQIIAEDIRDTLMKSGYEVIGISASGLDALAKTYAGRPELVSLDIGIKGEMDGIETAIKITKDFDIPVIFMSSNSDPVTVTRAKAVSPWFVRKPFLRDELLETAAKALKTKRLISLGDLVAISFLVLISPVLGRTADAPMVSTAAAPSPTPSKPRHRHKKAISDAAIGKSTGTPSGMAAGNAVYTGVTNDGQAGSVGSPNMASPDHTPGTTGTSGQ